MFSWQCTHHSLLWGRGVTRAAIKHSGKQCACFTASHLQAIFVSMLDVRLVKDVQEVIVGRSLHSHSKCKG